MAPRTLICAFIISALFITNGHSLLTCDNFCSSTSLVTCTCDTDTPNTYNKTVWKLTKGTQNFCNITLDQTLDTCNTTFANCSTTQGLWAMNDSPYMMTDVAPSCDSSTLYINKTNNYLNDIKIDCMSPSGASYGFYTPYPGPPAVNITLSCEDNTVTIKVVPSANGGIPTSYSVTIGTWTQTIIPPSDGVIANVYNLTFPITNVYTGTLTSTNCAGSVTTTVTVVPLKSYPGPPVVSITPSCKDNTVNVTVVPSANGGIPTSYSVTIGTWTQTIIPPSDGVIANVVYNLPFPITAVYTGTLTSTNCAGSNTTTVTVVPPKCGGTPGSSVANGPVLLGALAVAVIVKLYM